MYHFVKQRLLKSQYLFRTHYTTDELAAGIFDIRKLPLRFAKLLPDREAAIRAAIDAGVITSNGLSEESRPIIIPLEITRPELCKGDPPF